MKKILTLVTLVTFLAAPALAQELNNFAQTLPAANGE